MDTIKDRLLLAAEAIKAHNSDQQDIIEDIDAEDLARIANDFEIKPKDYHKLIGTMIYIRKRETERLPRSAAFKAAFPKRSIALPEEELKTTLTVYKTTAAPGEELSNSTLNVKAKRLENSDLYLKVFQLLQTNLYMSYAVSRMKVLDEALSNIFDPGIAHRDKGVYMKIFLEETRKPENAKQFEFNMNITNNDISVVSIEDKMATIANSFKNASASEIIEAISLDKPNDS